MSYKKDGNYQTVCPRDCFGVCSLSVTVENDKVTKVKGHDSNHNSQGYFCSKGASYPKRLYHEKRLKKPLLRDKQTNTLHEISWDDAYEVIIEKLIHYKQEQSTESVMYISGWGHTGIFNGYKNGFWSQYGPVTTTYGSLCMAAGSTAVKYSYGSPIKHNHNRDLLNSKLIIVWGANPANTNIHRMRYIKTAVKQGAKLIVIDPRVSETMIDGSVRIHPIPGTDALLAMGIAKLLIEKDLCDQEFIQRHVLGFDVYQLELEKYSMSEILKETGLELAQIEMVVDAIRRNKVYALVSGTGKTRYTNGGQTERAICILPALTGSIGIRGGGLYFTDNQQPKVTLPFVANNKMKAKIHVGKLAYDLKMQTPDIKMLWIEKANPLTSSPDVNQMREVMKQLEFIVVVEHFLTDTTKLGDLILPAAMFSEKDDLIAVYGDSYIHLLQKLTEPLESCKSEPEIYRELGQKMGYDLKSLPLINESLIDEVLNHNDLKTTYRKLSKTPYLEDTYSEIAYEDYKFNTPSGKIEIYSEQMKELNQNPLPTYSSSKEKSTYPLQLFSSHASERLNSQFTEMKLSKRNDKPIVQIHMADAKSRHIEEGDLVTIFNDRGEIKVLCQVGEDVLKGCIHLSEGWGDDYHASINKLIIGRLTDVGDGTAFHNCLVEVKK